MPATIAGHIAGIIVIKGYVMHGAFSIYFVLFLICGGAMKELSAGDLPNKILVVDRKHRWLYLINDGSVVDQAAIGIGRGGLKTKTSMRDDVTPLGEFYVDIVLSKSSEYNAIAAAAKERVCRDKDFSSFCAKDNFLESLYANMNSLDFNGDGRADNAYGFAYIGLDSKEALTGPKLKRFKSVPYWFSIALHGTPTPERALGNATSGGCVHVGEDVLKKLLEGEWVKPGSRVHIVDEFKEHPKQ